MATGTSAATKAAKPPVPTPIYRKQAPISVGTPFVKLNKTLVYRELKLELVGAPTLTAANNTAANTLLGDEWSLLSNISLTMNGSDAFRNFSGDDLWWLNWFWYHVAPQTTATIGDGATANVPFDSNLIIPLWMPDTYHPFDTIINGGRFNDIQLTANIGSWTALNASATAWTTSPTLNISSQEQVLPADPDDQPKLNWVVKKLTNGPSGANGSFRVPLDAGVNYARFLINIKKSDGTADAGSTTYASTPQSLVSNVKVVGAGGRVYADHAWTEIVATSKQRKNMLQSVSRRGQASNAGAWAEIDLVADGRLKEAMPNPADAYLEFNVLGACQINVLPSIIFPVG